MLLEIVSKYSAETEVEAKELIEKFRQEAAQKGYTVKKASYERKDKKAKGEVIATAFIVSVTQIFGSLWEDL